MKKLNLLALALAVIALVALGAATTRAHGADRGEAKATVGNAHVSIDYGRPLLKGRDMLKMLPVGGVWRIGADAPTTITSDADLDFGGTRVAKGQHILLARLAEPGKWFLVVSSKGAFQYEPSAKLAEVPVDLQERKDPVEELTITLTNKGGRGEIEIAWGTARLIASFAPAK
ncbi:MAG: DUF2911 domain-containing protein [Acidobacteriia bacterium]|nr:DUF2911 domain-containing protein [Terriglobia bacterium]